MIVTTDSSPACLDDTDFDAPELSIKTLHAQFMGGKRMKQPQKGFLARIYLLSKENRRAKL